MKTTFIVLAIITAIAASVAILLWGVMAGSRKMRDTEAEDLEQEKTVSHLK